MSEPTPIKRALDGFTVPDWADPFVSPDAGAIVGGTELALATARPVAEARSGIEDALVEAGFDVVWIGESAEAQRGDDRITVRIEDRRQNVPTEDSAVDDTRSPASSGWLARNMQRKTDARLAKVTRKAGPPPEMERTLVILSVSETVAAAS